MKIKRSTADALFSEYVRKRDKVCKRCMVAAESLQCAHIFSRRHWATRHSPDNAIALCFSCHQYFGENPLVFAAWCDEKFGRPAMDRLYLRAHATAHKSKYDEGLRVMALKEMIARQVA